MTQGNSPQGEHLQQGESTKAFSARIRGTATNCKLEKTCMRASCSELVSFVEETCFHVVLTESHYSGNTWGGY